MSWTEFKIYLSQVTALSQDALHIYAAVAVQLAAALLLRRSLAHPLPWLVLVAALLANEVADLREPGRPIEEWQVLGSIKDSWNTLLLPTLLMLLARYAPRLVARPAAAAATPVDSAAKEPAAR